MICTNNFEKAIEILPTRIKTALYSLPEQVKMRAEEIRIRAKQPLCVEVNNAKIYVGILGGAYITPNTNCLLPSEKEVAECYRGAVNGSAYKHLDELSEGYVTLCGGNRVGICGETSSGGYINVSSLNIRIANEKTDCASELVKSYKGGGILIAGVPGSGKTTMLRDTVRLLSNAGHKITVVDTRREISAPIKGVPTNNLGINTDVVLSKEKSSGMLCAIKTLSPEIIAFDEIVTSSELDAVMSGFYTGVNFIITAHVNSKEDLFRRSITKRLINSSVVNTVALLQESHTLEILNSKELSAKCSA